MASPCWERFYPPGITADFVPARETLSAFFIELVERHGDQIAIDFNDHQISYRQLGALAARLADGLKQRGIGPGDTVALYLPNSPFHPAFFFAVLLAGARVTHLSPLDAVRELAFKCRDSEARLLVALDEPPFADMALRLLGEGAVARLVLCDEAIAFSEQSTPTARSVGPANVECACDLMANTADTLVAAPVAADDVAVLQYTGGTTGEPKAAMLTHGNLTSATRIYQAWFSNDINSGPHAVVLAVLPLFHIMALVSILLRRFADGARLVLLRRFEVTKVLTLISRKRITGFAGVPTMWIAIANHPGVENHDLSSLQRISSGGAPLAVETHERIRSLTGHALRGGWGMTETCAAGTNLPVNMPPGKEGSVGLPLPGIMIDIVDPDQPQRTLAPGDIGEIRISGPNICTSYWRRPAETKASRRGDALLTGDLARMDEDGFIYIVERKKDLIVSSGYNVYPLAIENALLEHPAIAEAVVIGVKDAYRGEAAKAFVVLHPGKAPFSLDELRLFLSDRLGRHEMPQALVFRSDLPKTSVGKYSRKMLRDQDAANGME
ncbi:AMP-binding protein [Candidatus Raskinella chloraquaticus]|uniref:Long-chain-fatty-acid--CoA ligase n=1 Tax=Candidatus Raskinella chloraquaticus TaxID=1951219 RepID=A0A1W9HQW6_9HYPH|nr:MAG: hypothetical protein A4S15_02675 [Proteobacteria bacterium SG_bin8]